MSTKTTASANTTTRTASGPIASRRQFLAGSAAGFAALTVGFTLNGKVAAAAASELVPNPFVKVRADGTVVAILKHFEMGQGVSTGLTTIIAEEMDADWDTIAFEFAPADTATYKNLLFGAQGTGGSTAIANSWDQYRTAGAATRDLFVRAAAETWGVAPEGLRVASGVVSDGSGRSATFAELVGKASTLTPVEKPKLKDASDYVLIGKETLRRKDSVSKTDGSAMFAIDMKVPGMVHAVVARPKRFGATVASFDDTETRKVRGVVDVKAIPRGVVVYAQNTWAAIKGRSKLQVTWDESAAETRSSDAIIADDRKVLDAAGLKAANKGDAGTAITAAAKTVSAEFEFPFLAHAPMEPLNCIISFDGKTAELWDGCQFPTAVQGSVAGVLGIQPGDVKVNTMFAGGSFGRRTTPSSDYHSEAAQAVKAIAGKHPVKLVWTREDDLHGGYYRPAYVQRIEAGVDADGKAAGWRHRLAGKSILIGTFFESMLVKDGIDATSVEGASNLIYDIPNLDVSIRNTDTKVPVLWWRAVGHTHTAYSTEVVVDMMAEAAGRDPVVFRRELLANNPRNLGVLNLAAEKAGWDTPLGEGKGRGIAVHASFSSYVAQVVDVSVTDGGAIKVDRVVCAIDCGTVINPDIVRAQIEGGVGYGLGAAMRNKITMTDGKVDQKNFPDYEPLRMADMPEVEVHMVPSTEKPTGVGEPGVPPLAPALANAIFAATGKRIFKLPMTDSGITFA